MNKWLIGYEEKSFGDLSKPPRPSDNFDNLKQITSTRMLFCDLEQIISNMMLFDDLEQITSIKMLFGDLEHITSARKVFGQFEKFNLIRGLFRDLKQIISPKRLLGNKTQSKWTTTNCLRKIKAWIWSINGYSHALRS